MTTEIQAAKAHFIQGMSRISHFWGFPKAMGAIFGAIYLAPQPISLDDLVAQVGVSKGAVSTNVRNLERLGMIHKHLQIGDRKDYYIAETDFWKIIRNLLREREKSEFDRALRTVTESMDLIANVPSDPTERELAQFYRGRMQEMQRFFDSLDNLVAMVVALDNLRAGTLQKLFGRSSQEN